MIPNLNYPIFYLGDRMSFNDEINRLNKITIYLYLLILIIFTGLSILLNNKSFLEILPFIILFISGYHSRNYSATYEKYFKQKFSLFKIYLKVCFIPTFLFIIFSEVLLRIWFNSSLILLILR